MKLIIAITNPSDAPAVSAAMSKAGHPFTTTNSTGGFLHKDNTILFAGVDEKRVGSVLKILRENTNAREEAVSSDINTGSFKLPPQIRVCGAVAFVLDVEQFIRL